ncbi:MAG TPA: hypothetical protein P5056_03840 [Candidatus Paceibacterota bacterium]|nr:hypothetical protein [Candidatus Paceibacterota bacterium]
MANRNEECRYTKTAHYQIWAKKLMGGNFLGVVCAERILGRPLSRYERGILRDMPFSVEMLKACKHTHVLIAVPYITINEMYDDTRLHKLFCKTTSNWWRSENFAKEKMRVGWYLVRKNEGPDSVGHDFRAHKIMEAEGRIGGPDEVIAPANIVIYTMALRKCYLGEIPFPQGVYTRDSAICPKEQVIVCSDFFTDQIEIGLAPICTTLGCATMKKVY